MRFVSIFIGGLVAAATALGAGVWSLSEVEPERISQGWAAPCIDLSVDGRPLAVGGVSYKRGIGTHADSLIVVDLHGDAKRVFGAVGVDDEVPQGVGSVVFSILNSESGDVLWQSPIMKSGMAAVEFDVSAEGLAKLLLIASDANDGIGWDHADWLDVQIEYDGDAPVALDGGMNAEAKDVQLGFIGVPGGKFIQSGFVGRSNSRKPGLMTFPPRDNDAYLMPSNLKIIQSDGSHNLELVYRSYEKTALAEGVTRHTYFLEDPAYPVAVELAITAYYEDNVFESQLRVEKRGDAPIHLLERDAAFVTLPDKDTYITSFYVGPWELSNVSEDKVPRGILEHRIASTDRTALPDYPGVFLSFGKPVEEDSGQVFAAAIAWSGSWQYKVTRTRDDRIFFSAGATPDMIKLAPAEAYESPRVIMTWSDSGKGQASRNLHNYARKGGVMNGKVERPVILNSWEGVVFDFDEEKIIKMMDASAELGIEMFVLDDGWFGNEYPRNNDRAGLGDWQVNRAKLPGGIGKLIEEANKRGMKFGLWVEPEMVNPNSNLFNAHPDWIMQIPNRMAYQGRNQYLLDLSRPEVEEFVYTTVATILRENPGIAYIKWDHNGEGKNAGAAHLGDNQGALSDKHSQAYYRVMERLRKEFPQVLFQLCASGGARIDYGAMKYHDEFWASDETNAINRVTIQWGISHFFPSNVIGSHINRWGNGDYKLRADVAMTGRLGVELSPDILAEEDKVVIRRGIAEYKKLRPFLHAAELYRGRSPHESPITEVTFVAPDKSEAVFFIFKRKPGAVEETAVMRGLDPLAKYRLEEVNADETPRFAPGVFSGAELMEKGISFSFPDKPASAVVRLIAE